MSAAPPVPAGAPPEAQRSRGYARWKGARTAQGLRWWVIARGNLSLALANRWVKVLLVASLAPGIILSGITYFFVPLSAPVLDAVMDGCLVFAFLVAAMVGARMVSEDRRQGAFLAHFSRPVTRADYILGKLVALVIPIFFVCSASAFLGIAADASVDSENFAERLQRETGGNLPDDFDTAGYLRQASYGGAIGAVIGWSLVVSLSTAGIVLGLSALTTRARLAGVAWFAVVAFGWASHNMLQEILSKDWPALLSWQDNLTDFSSRLLGMKNDPTIGQVLEFDGWVRAAIPLVVGALGILVVHEQLRRAEGGMRG